MFALLRRPLLAHFGEQFPGFLEGAQAHEGLRELQLAVDRGGLGDFALAADVRDGLFGRNGRKFRRFGFGSRRLLLGFVEHKRQIPDHVGDGLFAHAV